MITKIKLSISIVLLALLVSCTEGFEEINTNPNDPSSVPTYGIFNNAVKTIVDVNTRGSFGSARMALPWVQYSAQRNYTEEDRFLFRPATNTTLFRTYYLQANNFKSIIDLNTNPSTSSNMSVYGNTNNQIAASRIMLAYIFHNLVDTYGDVPYYSYGNNDADFQALDINNITPKYASQSKIYTDILKELKEASEMIDLTDDIFYNGDVLFNSPQKLKKFANSLRLRIANRVKNIIPSANSHITDAIASGVMLSNNDNVGVKFENNSVNPAPTYRAFFIDNRTDYTASKTFVDLLKGINGGFNPDPRLQKIVAPVGVSKTNSLNNNYTESSNLNNYQGMPYGIPSGQTGTQRASASMYSYNIFRPDYTEILMEYAEVEFLLSENNSWNQINYEKGVRASMEKWGVATSDINTFVSSLPVANQANVLTQKYIALFMQPYEAWAELRRTGYPNILILPNGTGNYINPINGVSTYTFTPLETLTEVPTRLTYPVNEKDLNTSNYNAASTSIGGDKLNTKLIWDQN